MFMDSILSKFDISRIAFFLIIIGCFIIIGFKPNTSTPFLLNTGLVQTQEAEVSVILWSENGTISNKVWTHLPMPEWEWAMKEQQVNSGKLAETLTGHRIINKQEESMLYAWYTKMAPILEKDGVKVYIDERVAEQIDISAYFSQSDVNPSQWFLSDNLVSIAGYQCNLGPSVVSGRDRINIQLLSKGQDYSGHTVLAIPALLKEF